MGFIMRVSVAIGLLVTAVWWYLESQVKIENICVRKKINFIIIYLFTGARVGNKIKY